VAGSPTVAPTFAIVTGALGNTTVLPNATANATDIYDGVVTPIGGSPSAAVRTVSVAVTNAGVAGALLALTPIGRGEFTTLWASNATGSGCGHVAATDRGPLAAFHLVSADSASVLHVRAAVTLGGVYYTHPGRRISQCNGSASTKGAWATSASVCAARDINATGLDAVQEVHDLAADGVIFHSPVCHTTAFVLLEDSRLDADARCVPDHWGCSCISTSEYENAKDFVYVFGIGTGATFASLLFFVCLGIFTVTRTRGGTDEGDTAPTTSARPRTLLEWLRSRERGARKLRPVVFAMETVGVYLVVYASLYLRNDPAGDTRGPSQWVASEDDERMAVWIILTLGTVAGLVVARGMSHSGREGSTTAAALYTPIAGDKPLSVALTAGRSMQAIFHLVGFLVVLSPPYNLPTQAMWATTFIILSVIGHAVRLLCAPKNWAALWFLYTLVDCGAFSMLYWSLYARPCGSTPHFNGV
jgi:hypothetical protein